MKDVYEIKYKLSEPDYLLAISYIASNPVEHIKFHWNPDEYNPVKLNELSEMMQDLIIAKLVGKELFEALQKDFPEELKNTPVFPDENSTNLNEYLSPNIKARASKALQDLEIDKTETASVHRARTIAFSGQYQLAREMYGSLQNLNIEDPEIQGEIIKGLKHLERKQILFERVVEPAAISMEFNQYEDEQLQLAIEHSMPTAGKKITYSMSDYHRKEMEDIQRAIEASLELLQPQEIRKPARVVQKNITAQEKKIQFGSIFLKFKEQNEQSILTISFPQEKDEVLVITPKIKKLIKQSSNLFELTWILRDIASDDQKTNQQVDIKPIIEKITSNALFEIKKSVERPVKSLSDQNLNFFPPQESKEKIHSIAGFNFISKGTQFKVELSPDHTEIIQISPSVKEKIYGCTDLDSLFTILRSASDPDAYNLAAIMESFIGTPELAMNNLGP